MRFHSFVLLSLVAAPLAAQPAAFHADFRRDPSKQGFTVQGADDDRFAWLRGRRLAVALDSNADGSRLLAPLGLELDGSAPFHLEVDFELGSVTASPDDFFQIAFGLCSSVTTGLNRTGTSLPRPPFFVDDSDVFDSIEFDYYPNVTIFGGPFLQPTVFGAATGSAFGNFAANFGPSADLSDNGPGEITELPLGRRLRAVMDYDACARRLVTRVLDVSGRAPVELETGLQPLDLSVLLATGAFRVDSFAVHASRDLADFDPSTPSLLAQLDVFEVTVRVPDAPSARLVPKALNAGARAPVRVMIDDVPEGAPITLVESGGLPVSVALQAEAAGPHVVAEIPAALAVLPLALSVGDCLVSVDGDVAPR